MIPVGQTVAIVPHWNNDEGAEFDTSRSYISHARFERLLAMLPQHVDLIGIDEHTELMLEFAGA